MVRNCFVCGAGLVLTAALGLFGGATPKGLTAVSDADAGQVWGAGDKTDCKRYKEFSDAGCGAIAKPATNGVGQTRCAQTVGLKEDSTGDTVGKPYFAVSCYECCYTCGTALIETFPCGKKGSGPAQ